MKVTREMVLGTEMCTGMQASPSRKELDTIHVVPCGNFNSRHFISYRNLL